MTTEHCAWKKRIPLCMTPPHAIRHINVNAAAHTVNSVIDLGCQVELHVAVVTRLQVELDEERRIWAKTQLNGAAQWSRLCKVNQISERKCRRDRLRYSQCHTL